MAAFAYVLYAEAYSGHETDIIPTTDIKRFEEDYNPNKQYKVKCPKDGVYYRAYIVVTGETRDAVAVKASAKRIKVPSQKVAIVTTDYTTDEADCDEENVRPQMTENKIKNKKKENPAIINNYTNMKPYLAESKGNNDETIILKNKLKTLEKTIERLNTLNMELQEKCLKKFDELFKMVENKQIREGDEEEVDNIPPIGSLRKGNIHLGRGIFLPQQIFDSADFHPANKDSLFIKDLAVALFGERVLMTSSVTGTKCHRTSENQPKPKLDTTKLLAIQDILRWRMRRRGEKQETIEAVVKKTNQKIAEKIQDIIKSYHPKQKSECANLKQNSEYSKLPDKEKIATAEVSSEEESFE